MCTCVYVFVCVCVCASPFFCCVDVIAGLSDPYVTVYMNGEKMMRTEYAKATVKPDFEAHPPLKPEHACWKHVVVANADSSWLEFRVTDHDDLTSDEFMGSARLNLGVVCHCCCCCCCCA
jgi:Ca2+-dependent lipid-binding protein